MGSRKWWPEGDRQFLFIEFGDIASLNDAGNYLVGRRIQMMQEGADKCRSKWGWGSGQFEGHGWDQTIHLL